MATVAIVGYDPNWPDQFQRLAAELRRHLGEAASRIDHIGSTAVPGLAAKDVIDLQVTVASLAEADRLAPAFQRAGYLPAPYRHDHRPAGDTSDPTTWEKRLWQSPPGGRRVNLHVRVAAEDWATGGRPPGAVGSGDLNDQWQATGPPRSSTSPSSDTNRHS